MLEVVSAQKAFMGRNARRVVGESEETGFTIGRQETCNWVFPQDYVSRQQAIIRVVSGMYFLERKGNAPLAINDRSRPVERNRIVRLLPGDRILIDDIEILVSETDTVPVDPPDPPMYPLQEDVPPGAIAPRAPDQPGDILALLDDAPAVAATDDARQARRDEQLFPASVSPIHAVVDFADAAATAKLPVSPPVGNWWEDGAAPAVPNPGSGIRSAGEAVLPPVVSAPVPEVRPSTVSPPPSPPPPPAPPRAPAGDAGVSLDEVLRGAGLDPAQVTMSAEVARQLGEVLRIVVGGTMDVLKGRNDIRRELRVASTVIAPRENNPLKFSADVDDALHKLLIQRAAAYLGTVPAFREAFSDIRAHQIALLKSVGAAFDHMLGKFDPKVLENQIGAAAARPGVLGLVAKDRQWDAYARHYAALTEDRDAAYRKLFGEEWARAYEKELALQKSANAAGERGT